MPMFTASATLFTVDEGNRVAKSLSDFQVREMRGAMKAFLKACIPKIPVRTGFLRAAFRPMRRLYLSGEGADLDKTEFRLGTVDMGKIKNRDINMQGLAALFGVNPELTKSRFEHAQTTNARGEKLSEAGQAARVRAHEKEVQANLKRWRKTKAGKTASGNGRREWYYPSKGQRVEKTPSNALKFVSPSDGDVITYSGLQAEIKFDVQISYYRINDFYSRITGSPWRSLDAGFQASLNYLENAARRYPFLTEVLTTQRIYLRGTRVGKENSDGNQAADYRGRFGNQFFPSSGNNLGAPSDLADDYD